MNIKLQGLLNAAAYIERELGEDAYRRVLDACDPAIRERIETGIAIEWHPMDELVHFLETAQRVLHMGDELARAAGAEGARHNTRGALKRAALWPASPQYVMRRATGLWSQFNDTGEAQLLHMDDQSLQMEMLDVDTPSWTFCQVIAGWADQMMQAVGFVNVHPANLSCRARGDERCIIEVRYELPEK